MTRHCGRNVNIGSDRLRTACDEAGISVTDAVSHSRLKALATKRFHVMAILREADFSYPMIGKALGGRDHSSTWHGVHRWAEIQAEKVAAE